MSQALFSGSGHHYTPIKSVAFIVYGHAKGKKELIIVEVLIEGNHFFIFRN